MYTDWNIKLTCNQMKLNTQKMKNIRTIKASHLIQDHCGSMKGTAHCLNPRITFFSSLFLDVSPKLPHLPPVWTVHSFPQVTPPLNSPPPHSWGSRIRVRWPQFTFTSSHSLDAITDSSLSHRQETQLPTPFPVSMS